MKKNKLFLTLFLIAALVFSCTFSPIISYADEDEESTTEETGDAEAPDTLGGYTGLVAHWKFDGDLNDSTQFHNNGSKIGNIEFTDAVLGKGARFNGKSYIEVKDSDSLDLRNEFTFSLWVYKDDARDAVPFITKMHDEDKEYPYMMYEWWHLTPGVWFYDGESAHDVSSEAQVDIQKWTLVTVTYDGKSVKMYNNKDMVKSTIEEGGLIRSSQPLYIGFGNFMTTDNFYKGVMDDLRIYNKALTYEEVENLYDQGTKGSGKNLVVRPDKLVGFYRFEGNCSDLSGFKNDGTAVNANGGISFVDAVAGKGAKFNGSSYIEVKDSDSLDIDKAFTIGAWIYKEKKDTDQPIIAKYGQSFDVKGSSYQLTDSSDGTGQRLYLTDFLKDGEGQDFDTSIANSVGRWYYYTATYDGSNVKLFIDGVLKQTSPYDGVLAHSGGPLWIGATTDTIFFKGTMDEVRLYNYAMTDAQVKNLYNLRDRIEVVLSDGKTVMTALKSNQNIQLKANSIVYTFTAPNQANPLGKDEFKTVDVTGKAVYKSNNEKVATVSNNGIIKTVGNGKANITVTYGKLTKNISIVVK